MDVIDEQFCQANDVRAGQIYIIDNVDTVKVGASTNAMFRFYGLLNARELNPNAKLKVVYDVADEYGFEARAQAILNKHKAQNPIYKKSRNMLWGALDEHFSCDWATAMNEIDQKLKHINKVIYP